MLIVNNETITQNIREAFFAASNGFNRPALQSNVFTQPFQYDIIESLFKHSNDVVKINTRAWTDLKWHRLHTRTSRRSKI